MEKKSETECDIVTKMAECLLPCFGHAITNAKDMYLEYLLNVLSPLIYEGFYSIYKESVKIHTQIIEASKIDESFKHKELFDIFKHFLVGLKKRNNTLIEDETKRIRANCGTPDIFDDLIKAVVKSHISVLTCTIKYDSVALNTFHNTIDINNFIQKCYLECAKLLYDNVILFYHDTTSHIQKTNQHIIFTFINNGIKNTIKNLLPMKIILDNYLKMNIEEIKLDYIDKMKNMIQNELKIHSDTIITKQHDIPKQTQPQIFEKTEYNSSQYDFDIKNLIYDRQIVNTAPEQKTDISNKSQPIQGLKTPVPEIERKSEPKIEPIHKSEPIIEPKNTETRSKDTVNNINNINNINELFGIPTVHVPKKETNPPITNNTNNNANESNNIIVSRKLPENHYSE